ncbi:hypothetical protein HY989_03285 [Candidatus Micrarchaeota archaeon]|nr:hypothetical protein [Candidatus Micrarchaeota archaeon]
MNYLLVASDHGFDTSQISKLTQNDSLILLIAVERAQLTGDFESKMKKHVTDAEHLQKQLKLKNIISKVLVEWDAPKELISNCLAREEAILL